MSYGPGSPGQALAAGGSAAPLRGSSVREVEPLAIGVAGPGDAGEILTLQRAAFVSEALAYDTVHHPALLQTLDELRRELAGSTAYVARSGSRLIGAVRTSMHGVSLSLSRLTVAPDLQGVGIGSALLRHAEATASPHIQRFTLFTGSRSGGNLRLYRRLGYVERRREVVDPALTLVHLDKPRS